MEIVSQRDRRTLLPIIQAHTTPGTIIHSDGLANCSRACESLLSLPVTGVHTQMVESYWNRVKTKLKCMKGCDSNRLPGYLDEFMWRERYGRSASEALHNIMQNMR